MMNQQIHEQLEMINQQLKEVSGLYRRAVSNTTGTSDSEFWILYALIVMNGKYSQQDICSTWSLPKQTVNTIVKNLVSKGYATLIVVPGTRNRKIICLTDEGKKYGESIILPISEAEERAFVKLPQEDRFACISALKKFIQLLKEEFDDIE